MPRRALVRADQIVERLVGIRGRTRLAIVDGQLRGVGFDTVRVDVLDGFGCAQVGALLAWQREFVVERLPNQRMSERIARDSALLHFRNHLSIDRFLDCSEQCVLIETRHAKQHLEVELTTEHGPQAERLIAGVGQK